MARGKRTVLVKTSSNQGRCVNHCSQFGKIRNIYQYDQMEPGSLLVEYVNDDSVKKLLMNTSNFMNNETIPIKSRYVHYRDSARLDHDSASHNNRKVAVLRSDRIMIDDQKSLSAQMRQIHRQVALTEEDSLLRYFIASTIEDLIQRVLPHAQVVLFGSSVSGLGRYDSDLDMVVNINKTWNSNLRPDQPMRKLHFLTRKSLDDRGKSQAILQLLSGLLRTVYYPAQHVRDILKARVPIVRFYHAPLKLDCDLSVDYNSPGPSMSELLSRLCTIDPRFPVLVDIVRRWAATQQVTQAAAGPWLSNYMLTMLVVYYLQQIQPPVLPPLSDLAHVEGDEVSGYKRHMLDVNFPDQIQKSKKNHMNEGELLKGFFDFYTDFDFVNQGISVMNATIIESVPGMSLTLDNPVMPGHNCGQNVGASYLEVFRQECQSAGLNLDHDNGLQVLIQKKTTRIQLQDVFQNVTEPTAQCDTEKS